MDAIHRPFVATRFRNANILTTVCLLVLGGYEFSRLSAGLAHASSTGLVAAYSFGEGTGTVVNDSSGNGNNGTISGATWTSAGRFGSALSFNGTSSSVVVKDSPSLHLANGMTLEAWVFPVSTPTDWQDVIYKQSDIYFLEAGSSLSSHAPVVGGTFATNGNRFLAGSSVLQASVWSHLAATYDGQTLILYVNGIQVASRAMADSLTSSTQALQIGGDAAFGQYFRGTIDEVRIYNRALAPAEIQTDMTTPITQVTDTQPPTPPSNLTATTNSSTAVNLTWTASTDNVAVTRYLLERCSGPGCTAFAQIATPTAAAYTDSGLAASTSYSYRVRATDAAGNLSNYSNVASATTLAPADTTAPSAPTNLAASPVTSSQVNLSWSASTDNVAVTGYLVERCPGSGCTSFAQIGSANSITYSDSGLAASTSYSYRVRATDAAGNLSSYSNIASASTQAAAQGQPIVFVQGNYATPQSSQTAVSVPYSAAQGAGDLNVVVVGWNDSVAAVSTISDTSGNAYVSAVGPTQVSGALTQSIYYARNVLAAAANANVVTIRFNSSAIAADVRILEYSGLDPTAPLDVVSSGSGNSSSSASPSALTTNANDLILGANIVVSFTSGPGSGFAKRILTSPDGDIVEDKVVTTTGSYSATAPLSSSAAWIMQMVAFKGASSGSGGNPAPTLNSISIAPANSTIEQGSTEQFSARGTYSDGSTKDITGSSNWVSSSNTIATIGSLSGLATGMSAGTARITAQSGTISSSPATLTVTSSGSGSTQPALVQHVSSSNTRNNNFGSPYCYHYQLPKLTIAGNAIIAAFTFNSNPTPSVTDDKGDSYTVNVNYYDTADTQSIGIATAFNIAAGARVISVCFSGDPGGYVQPMATEFANVIGVDSPGAGSQGSGTSVTSGTLTPTVGADLAYQVAFSISVNQSSFAAGAQNNIAWHLLSADLMDGWAAQYGQYNSTAPINPTLTMGTSRSWISAGILLKTGTAGGVPTGMHIVRLVHENIPEHASAGGTDNPFPNPTNLQFASTGNLIVAMVGGGYLAESVTSITDTNSNSWSQAGTTQVQAGNDMVQAFYAANAVGSDNARLTVQWTGTNGDFTVFLYDVAGASSSPLDTAAGGTGSQSSAGNLTMPFSITPAAANELVFAQVIWDYNTGAGLVGAGWLFDTNTFSGESQSGPEPVDQNNGWGHMYTTGTAPVSITWIPMYSGLAVGNWAGDSVAFKPAP